MHTSARGRRGGGTAVLADRAQHAVSFSGPVLVPSRLAREASASAGHALIATLARAVLDRGAASGRDTVLWARATVSAVVLEAFSATGLASVGACAGVRRTADVALWALFARREAGDGLVEAFRAALASSPSCSVSDESGAALARGESGRAGLGLGVRRAWNTDPLIDVRVVVAQETVERRTGPNCDGVEACVACSALHVAGGGLDGASWTRLTGSVNEAIPRETLAAAHACAADFADTVPGTLFAGARGFRVLVGVGRAQRAGGGVKLRV